MSVHRLEELSMAALDVEPLIDGRLAPAARRSPFSVVPFFRSGFWPAVAGGALVVAALAWLRPGGSRG